MNELSETWIVVKKQGGNPESWLYQEVGGKRIFNGKHARDLQKAVGAGWLMLHATGHYEAEEWVGDPTHYHWSKVHPETGETIHHGMFPPYPGVIK